MKKLYAYSMCVMLSIGIAGCVNLEQEHPDIAWYALDSGKAETTTMKEDGVIMQVNAFSAALLFSGKPLMFKIDSNRYQHDYYNQFMLFPNQMITEEVEQWFASSFGVDRVISAESIVDAPIVITGQITELYSDIQDKKKGTAVIALECLVLDAREVTPRIMSKKIYREEIALPDLSIANVIDGWNKGLRKILIAFDKDVRRSL